MPALKISTASLHDPIEVEIDGKAYQARLLAKADIGQLLELDKLVGAGDSAAIYDRLAFLLPDLESKVLEKLPVRDIVKITNYVVENNIKPSGDAKNAPGPGPKK